jgi:uncharacterized protein YjbI with pentapeptide repeats
MHDKSKLNHFADEAAVRALYQQLMDGWDQGSGAGIAAALTNAILSGFILRDATLRGADVP